MKRTPENPVSLVGRKKVFENRLFTVTADEIIEHQTGNRVTQYLSVHPKHFAPGRKSGVAILPYYKNKGELFLGFLKSYRHVLDCTRWEVPRGFINPRESERKSAVRELVEETGYRVPQSSAKHLAVIVPDPGLLSARVAIYSVNCRGALTTRIAPNHDDFGLGEFRWFNESETRKMIRKQWIEDAVSITSVSLFLLQNAE